MAPGEELVLKKARGTAKAQVTKILNNLEELFKLEGNEAIEKQQEADDTWSRLEKARSDLKKAHANYSQVVLAATDEDKVEEAVGELFDYIDEVDKRVYKILHMSKVFKAKLGLEATKKTFRTALEDFNSLPLEKMLDNAEKAKGAEILHFPIQTQMEQNKKNYLALRAAYDTLNTSCLDAKEDFDVVIDSIQRGFKMETTTKNFNTVNAGAEQMLNSQTYVRDKESESKVQVAAGNNVAPRVVSSSAAPIKLEKAETITFTGMARDYARFKREFMMIVVPNRSETEVGLRLRQAVPKQNKHLLDNIPLENYNQMFEALDEEFGTADRVVNSIMAELNKLKAPEDDKAFVKFVSKLEDAARDLEAVDLLNEIVNQPTIASITEKFTGMIKFCWHEILEKQGLLEKSSKVIFTEMMAFLKMKKRTAQHNISEGELSSSKNRYCVVTGQTYTATAEVVHPQPPLVNPVNDFKKERREKRGCIVCSKRGKRADHSMQKCPIWTNLSVSERKKLVKCEKHIFTDDHDTASCTWHQGKCKYCDKKDAHHWLMCDKLPAVSASSTSKAAKVVASDVLLKTLKVPTVKHGRLLGVLEDNASTDNYVLGSTAVELKLKPVKDIVLEIEGINSTKMIDSKVYQVPLMDVNKRVHYVECYSLDKITEDSQPINPEVYRKICKKVGIGPGRVSRPGKIDVLLSTRTNYLMSDKLRREAGSLKLYSGPLGETISGTSNLLTNEHIRSYPNKATPVISSVKKARLITTLTDKQILQHFREESIGAECQPKCGGCACGRCATGGRQMTLKEEKEYKSFLDNMHLDTEGTESDPGPYWRTSYPWRIPREDLVDNKQAVLGVMRATERKLAKDPAWRALYEQQLKDLVTNRFAEETSEAELEAWKEKGGKTYWIAHQMALNPASKSSPIRTVFNSSQMYKGFSLNTSWDLGPDVTGNLHGILLRFRENIIGAQGDVRKMYYCVRVTEAEEYMQLFCWQFENEDRIRIFRMKRLVMGNKPSANSSQIALKETAVINGNDLKYPAAKKALVHNSYVDNTFTGNDDRVTTERNIADIEQVAGEGGFFYKPWTISGDQVTDQMVLNSEDVEDERALGIMWSVHDDKFYIKVGASGKKKTLAISLPQIIDNPELKLTLRVALSMHAKAYDPLGLILPTKMIGNFLFRRSLQFLSEQAAQLPDKCTTKLPWDYEITGGLKEEWLKYFNMLAAIEEIKFPRSTKPENFDPNVKPSLVTFSDGNEESYGCVAYILWTLLDGSKEARLLMAKAKLAPILNKGEVVKNELSGAVFAVRVKTFVLQNSDLSYEAFIPFIDSTIVRAMIRKESYSLNTFTGLRVKEIAEKSEVTAWNHINSGDNYVADILTRGEQPSKIGPGSQWQCGPSWLINDPETWPVNDIPPTKEERETVKSYERVTKTCVAASKPVSDLHVLDAVILRSSSLKMIANVTALLLRLRGRVGAKRPSLRFHKLDTKSKADSNPVTASEHADAMKILIEHAQKELDITKYKGFNVEIIKTELSSGKHVELVTLKSRVKNFPAQFNSSENHVYIIPRGPLAKKIVETFHNKYHRDVDTVVTHIRTEFWIPGVRRMVSQVDKHCRICLIQRQKVCSQIMGNLPLERSAPSKAFLVTTLDLFGPITIKDSCVKKGPRIHKKVWGCLFSCAAARAVHLDIADDYSTQAILHCVRRLQAERGQVALIISDPGTNLRGAAKELQKVRRGWDQAELIRYGAETGLEWKFVMASSQHQNGVTETLVKIVKGVMKSLMEAIGTTILFYNELNTLIKETQNLVNERPIGLKPNLQTDTEYLSPNSLLLGRCSDRINSGPFQNKASFTRDPDSDRTRFLLVQKITDQFWRNWTNLYFPTLLKRQKWHNTKRSLRVGDVCLLRDSNAKRGEWRMCRVSEVMPDEEEIVRNVKVDMLRSQPDGTKKYKLGAARSEVDRHVSNLITIVENEEDGENECSEGDNNNAELGKPGE